MICTTGCTGAYYNDDFVQAVSDDFIPKTELWFDNNLPDANNITYDVYTNAYVTDCVSGNFVLNDETFYYIYNLTNNEMYFNDSINGVSNKDVSDYIQSVITDYYEYTNIEVKDITISWKIQCNNLVDKTESSDILEDSNVINNKPLSERDIEYQDSAWIAHSYVRWNETEDEMHSYWDDVLAGRVTSNCRIHVDLIYDTYSDIASEIDNWYLVELYPAITSVKFVSPELIDGEYYKISRENEVLTSTRYYQYKTGDGETKWRYETLR